MLPFIDLSPSDKSFIYSTLLHIMTFDQPLWIKSVEIVKANGLKIVTRLGGFHTLMSFIESLGITMERSGLERALEIVYAPNTLIFWQDCIKDTESAFLS